MPTIKTRDRLAIGGQNANVIQGHQFEFLQAPSRIQVFAAADSTAGAGVAEVEIFLSQEVAMPQAPVTTRGAGGIAVNTDLVVDTFGDRGDRLVVREIETGGAAVVDVEIMVVITPI